MKPQSYKKTKISLLLLFIMLIASILYEFIGPEDYRTMIGQLYDKNGKLLKPPPYPPSSDYILGTDRDGRDNLMLIIDGIKYTFAALIAVSFLRVAIGTITGIFIENWLQALKPFIKAFFLPFQYVPVLLIGVFFMNGYLYEYNEVPVIVKVEFTLIVLFILGFPTVFFFVTDFIGEIKKKSFVTSSYLLGGSKWHIMLKQVLPHLKPQLALMFVQQVLQTLQIMMGLAMFSLFIGGPHKQTIYETQYKKSITNELAGLTGQNFWWLKYASYITLSSLVVLLIIFLLLIIIKNELLANMEGKYDMKSKSQKKKIRNTKQSIQKEISLE